MTPFRLLLIDDDEDEFVNIRALLSEDKRSRYEIRWTPTYEEGLAEIQKGEYDVCLLDYLLGERTGLDLLKEAIKSGVITPIILLTGQGDFNLDIQAMQIGAADYLVKDQLSAPLLERSVRYAMKHALDMEELRESKARILQQDRLASLGLLASSLAHEIGTPMGIIRSRAEMVEKKAENPNIKENMRVIVSQIDKVTKLVNSLLHLARGRASDLGAKIDLNQVIADVLNLVQHELHRKDIQFDKYIPENILVRAESGSLGQVFLNLLVNAVHAIEQARTKGHAGPHRIELRVEAGNSVKISVRDTGTGISESHMGQLFRPFFTTKEIGQGTGLGLATSLKLVQSWGGHITADNHSDGGAVFTVSLPRVD